jgi:hypothetical protein
MQEDCAISTQGFYQDFEANTEMTYQGQRTDGTHAINGTIYLETRSEDVQCSYNTAGDMMVDFVSEGQSWGDWVSGGKSHHQAGGDAMAPSGNAASTERPASEDAAQVQFERGKSGIVLEGAIRGHDHFDYALSAQKGQMLHVELKVDGTNGDGTIYFNILPPGSTAEAIYVGSMKGNIAEMRLTQSGPYVIRLYLMGNDRDTDKTVGYDLDVSIR